MLPIQVSQLPAPPFGGLAGDCSLVVGSQPTGSALHGYRDFRSLRFNGHHRPRLAIPLLWRLLTSRGISSPGSPQIRACCFPARPPHLPPRLDLRLRCVVPLRRIAAGLAMRFLFIGPPVSASLPPAARLPLRRWLHVVVLSCFHERSSYRRLSLHLQRAHAGRTQSAEDYKMTRASAGHFEP